MRTAPPPTHPIAALSTAGFYHVSASCPPAMHVNAQIFNVRLEESRSSKFPVSVPLHNLRFVMAAGDVEGLAERVSSALQVGVILYAICVTSNRGPTQQKVERSRSCEVVLTYSSTTTSMCGCTKRHLDTGGL